MLHLKKSILYKQLWWDIASFSFLNCESFSLQWVGFVSKRAEAIRMFIYEIL